MKMRYIMRGFTSVVRLPLFLIVVFTISAAAQEQPENNQFNGLDYTLQKPAKNERYAKKKFGDHLFISGEAGLILDRSAGSLFATPGLGLRAIWTTANLRAARISAYTRLPRDASGSSSARTCFFPKSSRLFPTATRISRSACTRRTWTFCRRS